MSNSVSCSKSNRITWIDWSKALLICFVVLGHSGSCFIPYIYSFHIPAFFFISGYLSNYNKVSTGSMMSFLPLCGGIVIYNGISIFVNVIVAYLTGIGLFHANSGVSFYELVIRPFWGILFCYYPDNPFSNPLCAQFWFVWVLIIMKFLYKFLFRNMYICNIVFFLCIIYICIITSYKIHSLFYIDRTIIALPFFIAGVRFRTIPKLIFVAQSTGKTRLTMILGTILSFAIVVFLANFFNGTDCDIFHMKLGFSPLLYYIFAFILIVLYVNICSFLPAKEFVTIVSSGTFLILGIHILILRFINRGFDQTKLIYLVVIIAISYPLIILSRNRCPILIGKCKQKKH